jgi:hypothetical protein
MTRPARRAISELLPEDVTTPAVDFITGPRAGQLPAPAHQWDFQIPFSPQLAIDGGLAHPAMPKDEAIGVQGVQNAHGAGS